MKSKDGQAGFRLGWSSLPRRLLLFRRPVGYAHLSCDDDAALHSYRRDREQTRSMGGGDPGVRLAFTPISSRNPVVDIRQNGAGDPDAAVHLLLAGFVDRDDVGNAFVNGVNGRSALAGRRVDIIVHERAHCAIDLADLPPHGAERLGGIRRVVVRVADDGSGEAP